MDAVKTPGYLEEMKQKSDNAGVRNVLIMCDGEGALGDPDTKKRNRKVYQEDQGVARTHPGGTSSVELLLMPPKVDDGNDFFLHLMAAPTDGDDERLLQLWNNFRATYEDLGYRRVSYEYFTNWLRKAAPDLSGMGPNEIQRRLHAYRKRLRQRKSRE